MNRHTSKRTLQRALERRYARTMREYDVLTEPLERSLAGLKRLVLPPDDCDIIDLTAPTMPRTIKGFPVFFGREEKQ